MKQGRLAYLSLLSIESDLLREMDFGEIVNNFASKKSRSVVHLNKCILREFVCFLIIRICLFIGKIKLLKYIL
jgi:hypothetical protein